MIDIKDWFPVDLELSGNTKFYDLQDALDIGKAEATGILILLWSWARKHRPDGNITGVSERAIADQCGYRGEASSLMPALIASGWVDEVDGRREIHQFKFVHAAANTSVEFKNNLKILGTTSAKQKLHDRDKDLCRSCSSPLTWKGRRSAGFLRVDSDGEVDVENVVSICRDCATRLMPLTRAGRESQIYPVPENHFNALEYHSQSSKQTDEDEDEDRDKDKNVVVNVIAREDPEMTGVAQELRIEATDDAIDELRAIADKHPKVNVTKVAVDYMDWQDNRAAPGERHEDAASRLAGFERQVKFRVRSKEFSREKSTNLRILSPVDLVTLPVTESPAWNKALKILLARNEEHIKLSRQDGQPSYFETCFLPLEPHQAGKKLTLYATTPSHRDLLVNEADGIIRSALRRAGFPNLAVEYSVQRSEQVV